MALVSVSILSVDFTQLGKKMRAIDRAKPDWWHMDVMDGHYVPNLSFGPPIIKTLRPLTQTPFEAHLMVSNPEKLLTEYVNAGCQRIIFHPETTKSPHQLIQKIHSLGAQAGICINNRTPIRFAYPHLNHVEMVLVMSVEAGFGGQKFNPQALQKTRELVKECIKQQASPLIAMDGGINPQNGAQALAVGVQLLIAGQSITGAANPGLALKSLKKL
ncbi:MAG: ribulose-phosphate 3-epimerase [Candidatus Diapherotrites archaeon]|nr:ribulose-phosphate 3-epimerase [Candidatus Diapherotrites archaeon]